ncbi:hypothetical protein EV363DRAFT_1190071 [Boletus edulis]|nr:hypothetical protein EV363DRAFT_1190071 [Boletus edulis]
MAIKSKPPPSHTKDVLPDLPAHRSSVAVVRRREREPTASLASANVPAISGKQCDPGFSEARPIHKFTAQLCKFLRITILLAEYIRGI